MFSLWRKLPAICPNGAHFAQNHGTFSSNRSTFSEKPGSFLPKPSAFSKKAGLVLMKPITLSRKCRRLFTFPPERYLQVASTSDAPGRPDSWQA